MAHAEKGKQDGSTTASPIYIVDIGTFLNMGNSMLRSYRSCMSELEKQDHMYETSHERIFRKLCVVTGAYTSEFDKFVGLSNSVQIPNSVERRLKGVIRKFNNNPSLNDALASARALALLKDPPENMGYSQIEKIFNVINASYKELSDRIIGIYNESMKMQVRIYCRKK